MKEFVNVFYNLIQHSRQKHPSIDMLRCMSGDNTAKGYAKKLRLIADELDKIHDEELPF